MDAYCLSIWDLADDATHTRLTLHTTQAEAYNEIYIWVIGQWDNGLMDGPPPEDRNEAISDFFVAMEDDYRYHIQRKTVYGPTYGPKTEKPFDPNEVLLDSEEVKATILAIECANIYEIAEGLGTDPNHCLKLVEVISRKLKA